MRILSHIIEISTIRLSCTISPALDMSFDGLTSPLSSAISISSPPTFSSPPPPPQPPPSVNTTRRRSPLSDAEKLDKIFECLRTDVYWSVSEFLRALAAAEGPVNTRRKTAFAAAAYTDSEVLGLYFEDEDQPWNGVRHSVIQALDLGNKELRKEVLQLAEHLYRLPDPLGSLSPFEGCQTAPTRAPWPVRPQCFLPHHIEHHQEAVGEGRCTSYGYGAERCLCDCVR